ncbi:CBS domain-containing protein [Rhodopila globiformis]|uniref:CBS domain-containing protein n=1 Tax=Rhodopila globiformis TaxID=1071 RepID=UPI001955F690|nr:CBS domain-containing protein [Rhodopila globiformis]
MKVRTTDTVQAAVRKLSEHRIGAVVVEDAWMRNAGIFSERDFVNATAEYGAEALLFKVERLMSSPMVTCRPTDKVETALAAMTLAKIRHLPVEENSRLIGIVSIGDLVKNRLDEKALEANVLLDIARLHA